MNIKFLGTGGFQDIHCGNSAVYIDHDIGRILIDCGSDIYAKLVNHDIVDTIDYVLLTHLHGDHMGSLFALIVHDSIYLNKMTSIICVDENQKSLLITLFKLRWADNWSQKVNLIPLSSLPNISAIDTYGKHMVGIQSYAFLFEDASEYIYYSGDLGDLSVTIDCVKNLDKKNIRIFHSVTRSEKAKGIHCYYKDIQENLSGYDIYMYHCNHLQKTDDCDLACVADIPTLLA